VSRPDLNSANLRRIIRISKSEFALSAGTVSRYWLDLEPIFADPNALTLLVKLFYEKTLEITKIFPITKLAFVSNGVGSAGVAILGGILSSKTNNGLILIDTQANNSKQPASGLGSLQGENVLIFDDVVSSGLRIAEATRIIRARGGQVSNALVVFCSGTGAEKMLEKMGMRLHTIISSSEVESLMQKPDSTLLKEQREQNVEKSGHPRLEELQTGISENPPELTDFYAIGRKLGVPDNIIEISQISQHTEWAIKKYGSLQGLAEELEIATYRCFSDIFRYAIISELGHTQKGVAEPDGVIKWTSETMEQREIAYDCKSTGKKSYAFHQRDVDQIIRYIHREENLARAGFAARLLGFAIISHSFSPRCKAIIDEVYRKTLKPLFLIRTETLRYMTFKSLELFKEYPETQSFLLIEDLFQDRGLITNSTVDSALKSALQRIDIR
jgi:orotate phosphoribosyltransferase